MPNEKLTKREFTFCKEYAFCRNPKEAAKKAGISVFPEIAGTAWLMQGKIQKEIKKIEESQKSSLKEALCGYRRLAFGSISDAVKLIMQSDTGEFLNPDELDLFMVSEIKKPKGGGMEIKFFDRQKALERIEILCEENDSTSALPFYNALQKSASCVFNDGGDDNDLL